MQTAIVELEALGSIALARQDAGLHDHPPFFQVLDRKRYLCHTEKHRTVFTEPDSELDPVPHRGWHGAGGDFKFPAIVSLYDLALWRSMRHSVSMASMSRDRPDRGQHTIVEHE